MNEETAPRRLGLRTVVLLAVCLAAMGTVFAQVPRTYHEVRPTLSCTRAIRDASMIITLKEAPPRSTVWWDLQLEEGKGGGALFRVAYEDPRTLELGPNAQVDVTDAQGRLILPSITLNRIHEAGRVMVLKMLVQRGPGGEDLVGIRFRFRVEDPGLYLPALEEGGGGRILRLDEITGTPSFQVTGLRGRPEKILFNRNGSRGFALLHPDRIALFDNTSGVLIREQQTGQGLVDLAVTPDGRTLLALTGGEGEGRDDPFRHGDLWIYDIEGGEPAFRARCPVGPVLGEEGDRGRIRCSGDSTLAFIREGGMTVGEYNLLTGRFHRVRVGGVDQAGGRVVDLAVWENDLLALVQLPVEGITLLDRLNLQTYMQEEPLFLGHGVERIHLFRGEDGFPRLLVRERAMEGAAGDTLRVVDFLRGELGDPFPVGAKLVDLDVSETDGLALGLAEGVLAEGSDVEQGVLFLFDARRRVFSPGRILVPAPPGARVHLSRSSAAAVGFLYYGTAHDEGLLQRIVLSKEGPEAGPVIPVRGRVCGPVTEIY